jgi:hypothetical protein
VHKDAWRAFPVLHLLRTRPHVVLDVPRPIKAARTVDDRPCAGNLDPANGAGDAGEVHDLAHGQSLVVMYIEAEVSDVWHNLAGTDDYKNNQCRLVGEEKRRRGDRGRVKDKIYLSRLMDVSSMYPGARWGARRCRSTKARYW